MSPDMPDNEDARTWFNCVEEIVFIDDDFNSDAICSTSNNMSIHRRKVQVLQAAYIVCLYQNWEGTDSSKSRIRRNRFATLVSVSFLRNWGYCKRVSRRSSFDRRHEISVSRQPLI